MGFLKNSNKKTIDTVHIKNSNNTVVKNSAPKRSKHEFKVLTIKDVNENRSKAYDFLTF